ncbi:restriction endonuclease subunit S [Actinomadura sp. NPDC047616]|uniref:restriction endonuclease subunit S n=1 Tax=Actinomadura sp. NPDC047616 TaxID=3155914 RepID=UPI0033DE9603
MIQELAWPTQRARFVFKRRDIRGVEAPLASATKDGVSLRSELDFAVWNPSTDVSNYKLVEPDDFVIGLRSFQHGISHSTVTGVVSPAYTVLRATPGHEPRYYKYYFRSAPLISQLANITQGIRQGQTIDVDAFRDLDIPVPPLEEQRRIADFLDAEISRIDRMLELRKRSVELLQERLGVKVDRLIRGCEHKETKLAEYAALGHVAATWRQGRLRSIDCEVQTGPFGSQLHAEDYVENAWPVINPANITAAGLVADERVTVTDNTRKRLSRHVLKAGDVIFGRRGELGRAAVVTTKESGWVCGTGCLRLRFRDKTAFHAGYLQRYLGIPATRHYFQLHAIGSTMPNLSTPILLNMPLLIPPLAEQVGISDKCDREEQDHHMRGKLLQRQMDLLEERRRALITAAVTGQFDVSTASGRGIED